MEALRRLAGALVERDRRVARVVLFGSLARSEATIRSDADILIVLSDHPLPPRERIPEYLDAFLDAPMPVDVFPFTAAELENRRDRGNPFIARIDREGLELVAGRPRE